MWRDLITSVQIVPDRMALLHSVTWVEFHPYHAAIHFPISLSIFPFKSFAKMDFFSNLLSSRQVSDSNMSTNASLYDGRSNCSIVFLLYTRTLNTTWRSRKCITSLLAAHVDIATWSFLVSFNWLSRYNLRNRMNFEFRLHSRDIHSFRRIFGAPRGCLVPLFGVKFLQNRGETEKSPLCTMVA